VPLLALATLRAFWALRRDPQFVSLALLAAVAIVSGTGFYTLVEGLRFVDAFYFSVITLTTVGYGDFAPQTDVGKLFTAVYVLFGVGILLAFVTTVAAKVSQMPLRPDRGTQETSSPTVGVHGSGDVDRLQALTIDAESRKLGARGELDHCGHGRAAREPLAAAE
jgi:hypothetical protein